MTDHVELHDGTVLPLASLPDKVSHIWYMGATHLSVCERLADQRHIPARLRAVYVNTIFTKSRRAKQVTALVTLLQEKKLDVRAVRSRFIGREFSDLFGNHVDIQIHSLPHSSLIDIKHFARFFCKVFSHRLFRLMRSSPIHAQSVLRAWVDTTDSTYPQHLPSAMLLIYPFAGSQSRQLRYVLRCRKQGRSFSLMGLPYRIGDLLRIARHWSQRETLLVEAEAYAFREHAHDLLAIGVKHVATTDDFSAASCELHGELLSHAVTCTNTSHGVGVYGPYVKYSHFTFYNEHQRDFYGLKGSFATSDLRHIPVPASPPEWTKRQGYEPLLVFVLGNWRQSGKLYEARFEADAIPLIKKASKLLGIPMAIKVHPNTGSARIIRLRLRHGVQVLRRIEEIGASHPVFLNTLSTSYYAFLHHGPTLFLMDALLQPSRVFGEHIHCVTLEDAEHAIGEYRDRGHWMQRHSEQIENETRRTRDG